MHPFSIWCNKRYKTELLLWRYTTFKLLHLLVVKTYRQTFASGYFYTKLSKPIHLMVSETWLQRQWIIVDAATLTGNGQFRSKDIRPCRRDISYFYKIVGSESGACNGCTERKVYLLQRNSFTYILFVLCVNTRNISKALKP